MKLNSSLTCGTKLLVAAEDFAGVVQADLWPDRAGDGLRPGS